MTSVSVSVLKLTSFAFGNNQDIPPLYTCDGANLSPPLMIEGTSPQALSLALIVDDPDAPSKTFTHWLVWNIPSLTSSIPQGVAPLGSVEGKNDSGTRGYYGPCPPSDTHRYFFRLYALDSMLSLKPETATRSDLESLIHTHLIDSAILIGLYSRI